MVSEVAVVVHTHILISAQICFNYLQQQFYLVTPSMKALAKGKNEEVILKLLKNLVGATQGVRISLLYSDTLIELSRDILG